MFNKYNMKKISLLLTIPIVLAASLVFGSLSFSVYGQESQTITPLGEQTANQTAAAPAAAANQTAAAANQTAAAPAAAANQTAAAPAAAANQTAAAANQTSAQNNQTSSQSSGGNLKLENILQWSNGAVQANEAGNGTGVSENLLKLQEYLKSSSGDKVISLPANQIGSR
jgi:zona occludens toxin (predicted ATPase)